MKLWGPESLGNDAAAGMRESQKSFFDLNTVASNYKILSRTSVLKRDEVQLQNLCLYPCTSFLVPSKHLFVVSITSGARL